MNQLINANSIFENIKHVDENGVEYWYARELQKALDYNKWQKFVNVISYAKNACKASNVGVSDHFTQVGKMVTVAKGASRKIIDYKLSRYACYLIAQNADSRKEAVALAQTYFAIQTRKQELLEKSYDSMSEDEKRLYNRELTRIGNRSLNQTAASSGVRNFARFHNEGYKGLYNGETADDIAKRKGLRYREEILDYMGSEELADNLFRIIHTSAKLKRDGITDWHLANQIHFNMGRDIRNFITSHGGTMPEELPRPKKSITELASKEKTKLVNK